MLVTYFVYVLVDKMKQEIDALVAHSFTCKIGRVVGCCARVITIIWFFGFSRFIPNINDPVYSLSSIFNQAIEPSAFEESEEDADVWMKIKNVKR